MINCVKTGNFFLSLTSALDMRLPRANPDVCAGASVGAGGCYGEQSIKSLDQNVISVVITLSALQKEEEIHKNKISDENNTK
jgi:hypothetical protein